MAIVVPTDAYCQVSDVTALSGRSYSATSSPTSTALEELIKQKADLIDGALSAGGWPTLPITSGAVSLNILQDINAKGAAAEAEAGAPGATRVNVRVERWAEEFERRLSQLRKGEIDLPDATKGGDTPIASATQRVESQYNLDSTGSETSPVFDRNTVW